MSLRKTYTHVRQFTIKYVMSTSEHQVFTIVEHLGSIQKVRTLKFITFSTITPFLSVRGSTLFTSPTMAYLNTRPAILHFSAENSRLKLTDTLTLLLQYLRNYCIALCYIFKIRTHETYNNLAITNYFENDFYGRSMKTKSLRFRMMLMYCCMSCENHSLTLCKV